ncbi:uncharacterized protein LOC144139991 [Haemaphysalis longicornis]
MLSMYVSSDHDDWDLVLPYVTYAYNTAIQATTGFSPFYLLYGREPSCTLDTVANFLALVGETTYCLASIFDMQGGDPFSEYLRTAIYACVRVITMAMCAWWIISANQARTTGMAIASTWIVIRAVANVTYAYASIAYQVFLAAFVLSRMYAFHRIVIAPIHPQAIQENNEEKEAAENGKAVFGDK